MLIRSQARKKFRTGEDAEGEINAGGQVRRKLEEKFGELTYGRAGYDQDFRSERHYYSAKDKSGKIVAIQRDDHDDWAMHSDAILTDYGRQVLSSKKQSNSVADLRKQALAAGYSKEKIQGMTKAQLKKLLG